MGKVIPLNNVTTLDIPVERVLDRARDQLDGVVLLGIDKNGEVYTASTFADGGMVLWLMEVCRQRLMDS